MKKLISILLLACIITVALYSCAKKEREYTLSTGTVLSEDLSSSSLSITSAAVVCDTDGRIVLCRLDCAELEARTENGKVKSYVVEKTKHELRDDYGMKENSSAFAEWYVQAENFEKKVVGKTLAEVGKIKSGDAELSGSCTIDVSDFVKAIDKAMNSDKKVSFTGTDKISAGIAIASSVADSGGNAEFLADIAAVVAFEGKTVAAIADAAEAKMNLKDGKGESFEYSGSKLELGDGYGMKEYGGAQWEWYEQSQSYADTAVGKSPDSLDSLSVENVSGCTINAAPLKAALSRAGKNLR